MIEKTIEEIVRTQIMRSTARPLLFFDIEICEHCNLNCKGCGALSCLAEEEYLDLTKYEKDIERLSVLSNGEVHHINILGGEPLLHPEVCSFLRITRSYFPHGVIRLITNGILLHGQKEELWDVMRDHSITLAPTRYPINVDYDTIAEKAKEKGVKVQFFGNIRAGENDWIHTSLDLEGERNEVHSFMHCWQANNCCVLDSGRLYPCPVIPNIRHFNREFGTNLYVSEKDGIDIYKVTELKEIMDFLSRPVPFCRYCNTFKNRPCSWDTTHKQIKEWI